MAANVYDGIYLNGTQLPQYLELKTAPVSNAAKNYSLNGTLYIDYMNNRRVWEVKWGLLTRDQVQVLINLYYAQYSTSTPISLGIPGLNLTANVYMVMSPDQIKYNGQYSENFTVVLEEFLAIS